MFRLFLYLSLAAISSVVSTHASAIMDRESLPIFNENFGEGVPHTEADENRVFRQDKEAERLAAEQKRLEEERKKAAAQNSGQTQTREPSSTQTLIPSKEPDLSTSKSIAADATDVFVYLVNDVLSKVKDANRHEDQEKILADMDAESKKLTYGESKEYAIEYVDGRYNRIYPANEDSLKKSNTVPTENSLPWLKVTVTRDRISETVYQKGLTKQWLTDFYNNNPDLHKQYTLEQFISVAEHLK